jgi:hypothetical protein
VKRSGTRRPWLTRNNLNGALKVRNINVNYSALSELHGHYALLPGATRLTLFGACPWLSYFAPSALELAIIFAPLALKLGIIFRAFGAAVSNHISRLWRSH